MKHHTHTHMCTHDNNGGHIFSQFRTWACAEYDMSSDVVYSKRNTEKNVFCLFSEKFETHNDNYIETLVGKYILKPNCKNRVF